MMTEVVAALIWEGERFLICQRPAHKARGLLWEFVGGKVEPGETPEQALIRQLTEYKAFKELSQQMQALEKEAKALITKLPEEYPLPPPTFELTGLTLEGLTRAFARVLKRVQDREEVSQVPRREIRRDVFAVQACMARIQHRLKLEGRVAFSRLFLRERLTARAAAGLALITAGTLLLLV